MRICIVIVLSCVILFSGCAKGTWRHKNTYSEYVPNADQIVKEYTLRARYGTDVIRVKAVETVYAQQMEKIIKEEQLWVAPGEQLPVLPVGIGVFGVYGTVEAYKSYDKSHDEWRDNPYSKEEDEPTPWLSIATLLVSGALIMYTLTEQPTGKVRTTESEWFRSGDKRVMYSRPASDKRVSVVLADNAKNVLQIADDAITNEDGMVNIGVSIVNKDYISESSPKWESRTLENTHEEYFYATVSIPEEDVSYEVRLGPYKNTNIFNR